jgi:PAS domain S-box-containing protein
MITLPGVTIQNQIYESAASLVYRGMQDNQAIVVKLLKQDYPSPQELTRYRQEYDITRSLHLEGVVKAYSQQHYQRTLAILLEDFGGESIERWIQQRPALFCPMPLANFFQLAINLTHTIGKIHAANIIHRDINPGNIVLNLETGIVKMIDFGIATRFDRIHPSFQNPHQLEGTLAYLSPEQTGRMNRWVDYRTDFYSLGVTFYELLTGQLPFPTKNVLELVHCHIAKPPVPPHELNATIPKPVSDLILKLMAKNVEDRYQSAWGIKADLEHCAQQFAERGQINPVQLGLQDVSEQFQIPQKLYGREAEIRMLLAAFDRVSSQDAASKVEMMLVSGCAGIGKSALVQELYQPITEKRGYFIWGKFDQFQRNIPHSAIVDALRKLVRQLLGEPDEQVEQWRSRLLAAVGSNGQLIVDVIPEVELIIGKQPPVPEVGATEAQNRFNRVFQQFIRVFCSKEHPLVLFLDDLQWIDSATLKLIELMLLDEQANSLFLIGAYRENELSSTHPLTLLLDGLQKQAAIQEVVLTPLALEPLSQLIAETLHHDVDAVRALAELVLCKTEGNPFFVNEFLKTLYAENCLMLDVDRHNWQWNIEQIQTMNITDNVVVLMTSKLSKLPESVQQILQLAACVGNEFDLDTLSMICERSAGQIFVDLAIAIQAGLILPASELDENLLIQRYQFLHDRVQQTAHALIDESQKQVVHLQIGRNLLEKTSPEQISERLFEIVDHLNRGIELITEQAERNEITRLNLMVGQKAKASIAYSEAKEYLAIGRECLAVSSWHTHYELTLDLYLETTEVAYLCGNFEQVEYWAGIILQEAKTILDTVKVYEIKVQAYMAQSQPLKALDIALQFLQQLGVSFPETPTQLDINLELNAILSRFSKTSVESLIHLPEMTDPNKLAIARILLRTTTVAAMAASNLHSLIVYKLVNLLIEYGNASVSASAYAKFGFILCGVTGNIELGYQFGKLALKLLSQLGNPSLKAQILMNINHMILHWKEHNRESLEPLLEAYQSGLEVGDLEYAAYSAVSYCVHSFFTGKGLAEVEYEMETYGEALRQLKQAAVLTWHQIHQQTVLNLRGCSRNPIRLVGKSYNEEKKPSEPEAFSDRIALFSIHFNKLILCYLFSEYAQAVEHSILVELYVPGVVATPTVPVFYFYDSLARLAAWAGSIAEAQEEIFNKIAINQEKMQQWAHHAPMNYLHKYYLVEAEKARVLGQLPEAEEFYEQAVQGARDNDYLQEEALAYELAAKHYLARGREKIAQTYMKEAHYCYERWGATAKVKDLETRYPQLLNSHLARQPNLIVTHETIRRPTEAIDLAAVMKAAQALSEMIHLDPLIATLMQVAIENAGAETGALILLENDRLTIMAQCSESRQCDLKKTSINDCATIPVSVIHWVERTQETLVFDDAVSEPSYSTDPYIQNHQTRSLLCMPILKQSQLIGILYLENNLSTGVFTSDRLQVLKLLMTQAAISLENARLYQQLENHAETLEMGVEERTQALQQEICDRRRVEDALRQSEVNYRNLVQTANSVIIRFDTQGRIQYLNDYGLRFFGYEEHEIVGRTLLETIVPEIDSCGRDLKQLVDDLFRYPESYLQTENENLRRDGRRAWVAWSNQAISDEQGQVIEVLSVGNDITQRKHAEAALQRSETKFRNIFENSQVGIFRSRVWDGLILDANQRLADLFGYDSPEEVIEIEHSTDVYVNPGDREYVIEFLTQHGELQNFEVQLRKRDGTVFWALYSARLNTTDGYTEGVIADISDRKSAEAALQASGTKLRTLITAIPDPICVITAEGRMIEAIAGDRSYKELHQEEHVGKTLHQLYAGGQADEFLNYIQQVLRTQQVLTVEYSHWIAGQEVWFSARIAPIQNQQVIWLARDITALKQAEKASILEERNRMAREIHDTLAQAFTGILIQVGAATQVVEDDPEATQAHLDTIEELARLGLTEARRSVTALRPQLLEEGDLSSALDRLVTQMRSSTDTTLIYEAQGFASPLACEVENNLLRIGQEALTNAIKYAHASEIWIELTFDDAQCCLRVKDDGQGFAAVDTPPVGGFGLLGMSERAERIGAQLRIESQPGQGTEIVVIVDRGEES